MVKSIDTIVDEILDYFNTEAKNPAYTDTLKRMDLQKILDGSLYDDGYKDGYDVGYEKGYDFGYDEGHDEGYDEGYDESHYEE